MYYFLRETERRDFLNAHKFKYELVSQIEKEILRDSLISCRSFVNSENFDTIRYYKTFFQNIVTLVKERQVFIQNGVLYYPEIDIIYIIESKFNLKNNYYGMSRCYQMLQKKIRFKNF